MRFPYTRSTVQGTVPNSYTYTFRPMVPVSVFGPTGNDDVFGRVDTGADDTLLPDSLIPILGMGNLSVPIPVGGIGGVTLARYGLVDLEIAQGMTSYRWQAYVGFYSHSLPVFGMKGFLSCFNARLYGRLRYLDLVPNGFGLPPNFGQP